MDKRRLVLVVVIAIALSVWGFIFFRAEKGMIETAQNTKRLFSSEEISKAIVDTTAPSTKSLVSPKNEESVVKRTTAPAQ